MCVRFVGAMPAEVIMRTKVELHPDVVKYVRGLPESERDDFVKNLRHVRQKPIERSTAHIERKIRGHMLRRFEFGRDKNKQRIAIFEYDMVFNLMRMLHCRFIDPAR
jgi:hypothetical protein